MWRWHWHDRREPPEGRPDDDPFADAGDRSPLPPAGPAGAAGAAVEA